MPLRQVASCARSQGSRWARSSIKLLNTKRFHIFFKETPIFFIEPLAPFGDSPYLALHRRGGDAWLVVGTGCTAAVTGLWVRVLLSGDRFRFCKQGHERAGGAAGELRYAAFLPLGVLAPRFLTSWYLKRYAGGTVPFRWIRPLTYRPVRFALVNR